jgi:hypothetical protein
MGEGGCIKRFYRINRTYGRIGIKLTFLIYPVYFLLGLTQDRNCQRPVFKVVKCRIVFVTFNGLLPNAPFQPPWVGRDNLWDQNQLRDADHPILPGESPRSAANGCWAGF